MEKRRKYDKEFKVEAVKLVTDRGTSVSEAARNLGIHPNLLHKWIKQYLSDAADSFPGKGRLKPHDEELRRLKKRLSDAEQERDILKKAWPFSRRSPNEVSVY